MMFSKIHHIAIICSDYQRSKYFYTKVLKLPIIRETFRADRDSYKLDLKISASQQIELFSFPNPPPRASRPEALGLRHLAFAVSDFELTVSYLLSQEIQLEPVRVDGLTGKKFTFFTDPDLLPIEIYSE